MLNRETCNNTVAAGFIATFVLTMTGFWQAGIGLPKMDVGAMLAGSMGQAYAWGVLAHFIIGIILALMYVQWFRAWLPGPDLLRGLIYGVIACVAAALIVVPLATASTEMPAGVFFSNTDNAGGRIIGCLIMHVLYGISLGIAYREPDQA
ncbi:MAG: DUF2938 family protein [Kiritimatiellia bacterium]|jgi:uncharacterized membrane protein YagU involved in acid resistance|nr:DUF2938 family protein [Kiritimatiellia bacterium]